MSKKQAVQIEQQSWCSMLDFVQPPAKKIRADQVEYYNRINKIEVTTLRGEQDPTRAAMTLFQAARQQKKGAMFLAHELLKEDEWLDLTPSKRASIGREFHQMIDHLVRQDGSIKAKNGRLRPSSESNIRRRYYEIS